MAEGEDKKGHDSRKLADEMFSFYRELSLSNVELRQSIRELIRTYRGDGEERPGLFAKLDSLEEAVGDLEENVTEQNLLLHRYSFVADRIVETMKGDATADPPVAGRAPTLEDVSSWLVEFDEMKKKEEAKAEEEERREAEEEAKVAAGEPAEPKMPMLANADVQTPGENLPPLPVMPDSAK